MATEDLLAFLDLIFNQGWLWLFSIALSIFFILSYLQNQETDEWLPYDQVLNTDASPRGRPLEELGLLVDMLRSSEIKGYVFLIRRELSSILAAMLGMSDSEFIAIRSSSEEMKKIIPDKDIRLFFFNPALWMNSVGSSSSFLFRKVDEEKVKVELYKLIEKLKHIYPNIGDDHEF
ncbi:MAG: hypothetical protein D6732_08690 [Methanobacteriota archaeon]|nr:MAG: hypothetical protein D6732_08690 [Euryarchaeota archaeon]